jgi:hypothetical protein
LRCVGQRTYRGKDIAGFDFIDNDQPTNLVGNLRGKRTILIQTYLSRLKIISVNFPWHLTDIVLYNTISVIL